MNILTSFAVDHYEIIKAEGYTDGSIILRFFGKSELVNLFWHVGPVCGMDFGTNDDVPFLASVGYDGFFVIWEFLENSWGPVFKKQYQIPLTSVSVSQVSKEVAIGLSDGTVELISIEKNWPLIKLMKPSVGPIQVSFSPQSSEIGIGNNEGMIFRIEGSNKKTHQISSSRIMCLKSGAYGIAAICSDYIVRVLIEEKTEEIPISGQKRPVTCWWSLAKGSLCIIFDDSSVSEWQKLPNEQWKMI